MANLSDLKITGSESIFEDSGGNQFLFSDADINAKQIVDRGLRFVRGTDVNPDVRKRFTGGIELPDQPDLPNIAGVSAEVTGIAASLPAVSREDVEARTREEFAPGREILERGLEQRIQEQIGLGEEEERALGGALGVGRRFSSSAQAFIKFIDDKNKETVSKLELQRDSALADFDFQLAGVIDQRITSERNAAQQEFQNAFKIIDFAIAQRGKPSEDTLQVKSEKDAAILGAIDTLNLNKEDINAANIFRTVQPQFETLLLEDVTSALESIGEAAGMKDSKNAAEKLTGDAKNFFLLKEFFPDSIPAGINALPENQQLGAYMKFIESGGEFIGGGGSLDDVPGMSEFAKTAQGIRMARAMFGTGRALSDQDREIGFELAKAGRAEGLSEIDMLKGGLGYIIERNVPFADNILEMLIANAEEGLSSMDLLGLARLINVGKEDQAIVKAEDVAYRNARDLDPDTFTSEVGVRIATRQVNNLVDFFDEKNLLSIDETAGTQDLEGLGAFEGTMQKFLTRRFRGEEEAEVLTRVKNLIKDMVKEMAGVNITESEQKFIEDLIPAIDEPAANFMFKLNQLKTIPLLKLNSTRRDRSMPEINETQLFDRSLRVPLYSAPPTINDGNFFNNPVPSGEVIDYNPNVWGNVTI